MNAILTHGNEETGRRGPTQADILIELAAAAELFHTPDGTGFADIDVNRHRETWPIRSKGFRRWLTRGYFDPSALIARWHQMAGKRNREAPISRRDRGLFLLNAYPDWSSLF
jgi:hypothetical protein